MRIRAPYKQLNQLIERETIESTFSWGLRMAIAATVPIIWGISTNHVADASWITLAAECICWMELKGSFGQGVRVLAAGLVLTLIFGLLGTLTANSLVFSVICMFAVGFIAGQFKNLGDRGSGLAICTYVLFVFCNAYPAGSDEEIWRRAGLILIGGSWNMTVGIFITLLMPAREPYRRTIAHIWKSIAVLSETIAKGWDSKGSRSSMRNIYLKEKEVRTAIDNSFHFYTSMAHQVSKDEKADYQLAQIRKATALVSTYIAAISEELENINIYSTDTAIKLKIYATLKALQQVSERMAVYVITLQPEEELLLTSRIDRLNKLAGLIKVYEHPVDKATADITKRIVQLTERTVRLIESVMSRLQDLGDDKAVYRSYSLIKTLFVLHPKHWLRNLKLLLDPDAFTVRYALRAATAATIALFISRYYEIDHGYWIPFTAMIVTQPYLGATIKKATDRVLGTVLGGIAGGLILRIDPGVYVLEVMLFFTFIFMIYFIRRKYAVATFFITFSLVLLFNMESALDQNLLITRALSTIGGASLAIIAGFALLPSWDTKWLPVHIANAIKGNYQYFLDTFYSNTPVTWTRNKRIAESRNSNAFDSFNRYMQEPSIKKKPYKSYYHIITHNVRITRELNNLHLEQENRTDTQAVIDESEAALINSCLKWMNRNMQLAGTLSNIVVETNGQQLINPPFKLTLHQKVYLDKMLIELKTMQTDLQNLISLKEAEDK